ncbi:hypothetical protein NE237_000822 [Protea cynaroides]|uniref:Uncharacterized protein n=1 Tax=Protea cynaroides TaxID=273540 RepID=A0A9Q0KS67_9MAGN|nr:hypothetical protein NE237_000822 [Protea cynaroides]
MSDFEVAICGDFHLENSRREADQSIKSNMDVLNMLTSTLDEDFFRLIAFDVQVSKEYNNDYNINGYFPSIAGRDGKSRIQSLQVPKWIIPTSKYVGSGSRAPKVAVRRGGVVTTSGTRNVKKETAREEAPNHVHQQEKHHDHVTNVAQVPLMVQIIQTDGNSVGLNRNSPSWADMAEVSASSGEEEDDLISDGGGSEEEDERQNDEVVGQEEGTVITSIDMVAVQTPVNGRRSNSVLEERSHGTHPNHILEPSQAGGISAWSERGRVTVSNEG